MSPLDEAKAKIKEQLEWRGPSGKLQGHIVLSREQAGALINHNIEEQEHCFPDNSERFLVSDFTKTEYCESKWLPGKFVGNDFFCCPSCSERREMPEHNSYHQCQCGLHSKSFGNSLYVWRSESVGKSNDTPN